MTHRKYKWFDLQQKYYGEFGRWECFYLYNGIFVNERLPTWHENTTYKLEEIRPMYQLNDVQYPAPETEPLEIGQIYFIAVPGDATKFVELSWRGDGIDKRCLAEGIIHLKQESAIQHATAMLSGKPVIEGRE